MLSTVHKYKLRFCQWCGGTIKDGDRIFHIPEKGKRGSVIWRKCFCAPDCAVAGIREQSDHSKLPPELHAELLSIFQTSITRTDSGQKTHEEFPSLTITAAPNPVNRVGLFGGPDNFTPEMFRKEFDPRNLMKTVFAQKIPENEANIDAGTSSADDCEKDPSGKWKITTIEETGLGRLSLAELCQVSSVTVKPPRNCRKVIRWLQSLADDTLATADKNEKSFVVYTTDSDNLFCLGRASSWIPDGEKEIKFNTAAYRIVGTNVAGSAVMVHVNELRYRKTGVKKSPNKKESNTSGQETPPLPIPIPSGFPGTLLAIKTPPLPPPPPPSTPDSPKDGRKRGRSPTARSPERKKRARKSKESPDPQTTKEEINNK